MRNIYSWLLSVCLFLCSSHAIAQVASFTYERTDPGCPSSLRVNFTNTSTGFSTAATYNWDFGNNKHSANENPSTTYDIGDTYFVTLTVSDNDSNYIYTDSIVKYKNPIVDFSTLDSIVCPNSTVTYISNSTAGDGVISSYLWEFGDGNTLDTFSTVVTHEYQRSRNVSASLSVVNNYGCITTITKANIVNVQKSPVADFTPGTVSVCNEGDAVAFTSNSTNAVDYLWDFGDGSSSTEENPTHAYALKGDYNVHLTVTSEGGCNHTSDDMVIKVASSRSDIVLPTLMCLKSNLLFTDNSNPPTAKALWLLDNVEVARNVHTYSTVFTDLAEHKLQLVNEYGTCSDTATQIIKAQTTPAPIPFDISVNGKCGTPATVTVSDAGTSSSKWEWDFNNTDTDSFSPTDFEKSATHVYNAENTYYIKLRVTDPAGCTGEVRQPVVIAKNKTTIVSSDGIYGCKSLTSAFSATSTNPVSEYQWTFSDDGSTSAEEAPQHTFGNRGTFTVSLHTETAIGCSDTAFLKVFIGDVPNFDFTVTSPNSTVICGNNKVTFTVTGTDKTGKFWWNFGDSKDYLLINGGGPSFTHQYKSDSIYTVSLVIDNNGCTDTITKQNYVTVLPPFPDITSLTYDCNDRTKVTIKEVTKKTDSYIWNFGDNTDTTYTTATAQVVHHYPKTGKYKVTLTASSNGCVVKDSAYAYVLEKQEPVFSSLQSMLCLNDSLLTTVSGMEASPYGYNAGAKDYTVKKVEYQNGSPFYGTFSYPDAAWQNPFHVNIKRMRPGDKVMRLITNSRGFNCPDTTNFIQFHVNGPVAGFTIGNTTACLSDKIVFTDTSIADSIYPINKWEWYFGDSTSQTLTFAGNTAHKYSDPGNYDVKLVITDDENCSDTTFYSGRNIEVKGPKAVILAEQNPILPYIPEVFTNLTESGTLNLNQIQYTWLFGDGDSLLSNDKQVSHIYRNYADDTARLIATSAETGCSDTASTVIQIKNTNLSFTYITTNLTPISNCPPVLVNFTNTSENFDVVSWDFGDGATADNLNKPSHKYDKPGVYKVIIYGYYNTDTYDSTWQYVTIAGPIATVRADVLTGCGARQVVFSAETTDATDYTWDFGDGELLDTKDSIVTHTYTLPNVYTPSLTVTNADKCAFAYNLNSTIVIDTLKLGIGYDSVLQCHQALYHFYPNLVSVANNNGQPIDYTWQFSDRQDAPTTDSVSRLYQTPGTYTVSVTATSPYGCRDTATQTVTVAILPPVSIDGPDEICENTPVVFKANKTNNADALTYFWQFQNSTSTLQNPPAQVFSGAGRDSVMLVVNNNGCTDTLYKAILVHQQPKIRMLLSDSIVCLGGSVVFDAVPANVTVQDPIDYLWVLGTGKDTAALQSATFTYGSYGTYPIVLNATSAFGCKLQLLDTVTVSPAPKAAIQGPLHLCIGSTATFTSTSGIATAVYAWHYSDGTTSILQNPPSKTYTTSGIDSIYLVASIGGCRDTAYHNVTIHDNPQAELSPSSPRICRGDTLQLTAHNGQKYQWQTTTAISNTTIAAPLVYPSLTTNYKVLVTDGYGCKSTDSVTVMVTQPMDIKAPSLVNACIGSQARLTATGTDTYYWINGSDLNNVNIANPVTIEAAQNKSYTVVGYDAYGCFSDTATVQVVVREKPLVEAGDNQVIPAGVPVNLSSTANSSIANWNWQPSAYLSCTNCAAPVSKLRQSTVYTVTATDHYGCQGTDTVSITVVCKDGLVSVPEVFSPNGDGKNDRFRITAFGVKTITHLVIFSRNGNKVFEKNNVSPLDIDASWNGMYNSTMMPVGTYVYVLQAVCDAGEVYNLKGTVTLVR